MQTKFKDHSRLPDGEIEYEESFLETDEADRLFDALNRSIQWSQHYVRVFGREYPCPRLSAWYGNPTAIYRYSGQTLSPEPWTRELQDLRRRIGERCRTQFDSVLLNLYRDGKDGMGWHSDDERELGPEPVIASLSLGAVRRFKMKHRRLRDLPTRSWPLANGSLFIMRGSTQHLWKHEIPKTRRVVGPRINLTFRWIGPENKSL